MSAPPPEARPESPAFRVSLRPRYNEVDSMGVVYHAQYLVYFDVGRTELMRARGLPYAELETRGYQLVVMDVGLRYRHPARYDEPLELLTRVARLGHATLRFEYQLLGPAGRLLVEGHTRLGCLGPAGRPAALPADVVRALSAGDVSRELVPSTDPAGRKLPSLASEEP